MTDKFDTQEEEFLNISTTIIHMYIHTYRVKDSIIVDLFKFTLVNTILRLQGVTSIIILGIEIRKVLNSFKVCWLPLAGYIKIGIW